MTILGSRKGFAEKLSTPMMVLAFLAVAGFVYWLTIVAQPAEVLIEEEETPEEAITVSAILALDEFLGAPGRYQGQVIEITGARVASRLGPQAFWVGPDDRPYLVKMAPPVVEEGVQVQVEQRLTLWGSVAAMSDSVLASWDTLGVFASEGDRLVAEFATTFLEALRIRGWATEGAEEGSGS